MSPRKPAMTINGQTLTVTQAQLVLALLREEKLLGRMGEKARATTILQKLGEE